MLAIRRLVTIVLAILLVLYPLLVYFGLQEFGPRALACVLLLAAAARLVIASSARQSLGNGTWLLLAAVIAGGLTLATGSVVGLKFYPVVVNVVLLGVFSLSLKQPPTMIERFARLQHADLPTHVIAYTRKVTWVWCGFFVINGVIAAVSVFGSDRFWALYNGLFSYVLMGALLAGEYIVRLRVQKAYARKAQHSSIDNKFVQND